MAYFVSITISHISASLTPEYFVGFNAKNKIKNFHKIVLNKTMIVSSVSLRFKM